MRQPYARPPPATMPSHFCVGGFFWTVQRNHGRPALIRSGMRIFACLDFVGKFCKNPHGISPLRAVWRAGTDGITPVRSGVQVPYRPLPRAISIPWILSHPRVPVLDLLAEVLVPVECVVLAVARPAGREGCLGRRGAPVAVRRPVVQGLASPGGVPGALGRPRRRHFLRRKGAGEEGAEQRPLDEEGAWGFRAGGRLAAATEARDEGASDLHPRRVVRP